MSTLPHTQRLPSRATLEIVGRPAQSITVFVQQPSGPQPQPIFEGVMPAPGRIRLRVPLAHLIVVVGGERASIEFKQGQAYELVDLRGDYSRAP